MPTSRILDEAQKLYCVSDSLDSLADDYPAASDAIMVISGNVRNSGSLLEVLVATRFLPNPGVQ
jgi:hypothetical protein